jgi:16S rRNA U1498 N3-methylase RsmE
MRRRLYRVRQQYRVSNTVKGKEKIHCCQRTAEAERDRRSTTMKKTIATTTTTALVSSWFRFFYYWNAQIVLTAASLGAVASFSTIPRGQRRRRQSPPLHNRHYSTNHNDNFTTTTTTKTTNLPRLYVGEIPTEPIPFTNRRESVDYTTRSKKILFTDSILSLSSEQSHYVSSVMRLTTTKTYHNKKQQQLLRLFDGSGEEWLAEILPSMMDNEESCYHHNNENPHPRRRHRQQQSAINSIVQLQCRSRLTMTTTPHHIHNNCYLCMAPPKLTPGNKDRIRWLIEKTTELGCHGYLWLQTDHSEYNPLQPLYKQQKKKQSQSNKKSIESQSYFHKLHAYAVEASEQCERLTMPQFFYWNESKQSSKHNPLDKVDDEHVPNKGATPLFDFWKLWQQEQEQQHSSDSSHLKILICRERGKESVVPVWQALDDIFRNHASNAVDVAFLIGPEGGWSSTEEQLMDQLARNHPDSILQVSLGENVLRVETAAVTAVGAFALHRDYFHYRIKTTTT